jgi:putative NADH-flavin reductase
VFDWISLIVGVAGSLYISLNARRLADQPRRGTEWNPSYRTWLLAAVALALMAIAALISILDP